MISISGVDMVIKNVYVITHAFCRQDLNNNDLNKDSSRLEERCNVVKNIIGKCKNDPGSYMVFVGLESDFCNDTPPDIMDALKGIPKKRLDYIDNYPCFENLPKSNKKLSSQELADKVNVYAFGSWIGACLKYSVSGIVKCLKKKTDVGEINLLGGDCSEYEKGIRDFKEGVIDCVLGKDAVKLNVDKNNVYNLNGEEVWQRANISET